MAKKQKRDGKKSPVGKTRGTYDLHNVTVSFTGAPVDSVQPVPYKLAPWAVAKPAALKPVPVFMSTDSAVRKRMPVTSGCLAYFPDALLLVSWVSKVGNDKHNPGQPLHWAKEKSTDEPDCEVRHMLDHLRGDAADPGLEPLGELGHLASKAWRALAHLQRECDRVRKEHGR